MSNQLLQQSAMAIDQVLVNDLRAAVGVAFNSAALVGTGSADNMPLGLVANTGVSTITFSAAATYSKIFDFEKTLELANVEANDSSAFIASVTTKNKWRKAPQIAGYPKYLWNSENEVAGYPAIATTLLETGNQVIFGRFSDMVIGTFGALGLVVDPYSLAEYHKTRLIVTLLIDTLLRNNVSFCVSTDSGAQ